MLVKLNKGMGREMRGREMKELCSARIRMKIQVRTRVKTHISDSWPSSHSAYFIQSQRHSHL